jgi:hypothetical protein
MLNWVFRWYMYKYCNIWSFHTGLAFFQTLFTNLRSNLCWQVHTLCISIDFHDSATLSTMRSKLWDFIKVMLLQMTQLIDLRCCLCLLSPAFVISTVLAHVPHCCLLALGVLHVAVHLTSTLWAQRAHSGSRGCPGSGLSLSSSLSDGI